RVAIPTARHRRYSLFLCPAPGRPRYLPSFPTRRSSDLARLELARVLHLIGKEEDGLAVLRGIETPDTGALLLRADIQRSLGRTDEALADEDAAIRAATEGRDLAYRHKGRLLLDLGRPKEAVAAFDAALGLDPTDAEAWFDAARAWQALGQEGRARKLLDEALRLDPDHAQARRLRSERATAD